MPDNIDKSIDLNCDMGEGMETDASIMPFISSANIACGYHAGDVASIVKTIQLAQKFGVQIGAHPSFPDREHFGRKEMHLDENSLYEMLILQIDFLNQLVTAAGGRLHHVKPHGALYNMAARDPAMAKTIARAVKAINPSLVLYGLSGSCLVSEADKSGLAVANEVFADRTYQPDGNLTPRHFQHALITDPVAAVEQVLQIVLSGYVQTNNGKKIHLPADTVCLHGDGEHALLFAENIHTALTKNNIAIRSFL